MNQTEQRDITMIDEKLHWYLQEMCTMNIHIYENFGL